MFFLVPSYSQYLDVSEKKWRGKSCGIVALKMLLDYRQNKTLLDTPTISTLIRLGLAQKAYIPGIGWKHRGLADLASHFGYPSKNYDWASQPKSVALKKLFTFLNKQPVIASIYGDIKTRNGGHLVVLIGINKKQKKLYLIDPAEKTRKKERRNISIKKFSRYWKQRIIIVKPPRLPKKKRIAKV